MLAASGCPKMPKTPHSSLNLSNMDFLLRDPFGKMPVDGRRPHALGLVNRLIDHTRSAYRHAQPISAGLADRARRHLRRRGALEDGRELVRHNRHDDARRGLAE